jgi:hypothetical protein
VLGVPLRLTSETPVRRPSGSSAGPGSEIVDGDRFVSPREQTERIRSVTEREGLRLVDTIQELDVSGGARLAKRHGLRRAVEWSSPVRPRSSSSPTSIVSFDQRASKRQVRELHERRPRPPRSAERSYERTFAGP